MKSDTRPGWGKVSWPSWMYGPNGEKGLFKSAEDVPEGWMDHEDKHGAIKKAPPASKQSDLPMTKPEIMEALAEGSIPFNKSLGAKALYDLLTDKVKEHLTEAGVEFDPTADTKTLLELLKAPSE